MSTANVDLKLNSVNNETNYWDPYWFALEKSDPYSDQIIAGRQNNLDSKACYISEELA